MNGVVAVPASAQATNPLVVAGVVADQATHRPLAYVSVGVLRRPLGTVADARGRFSLGLPTSYDADSVRFSLVGYASTTVTVAELRRRVGAGPLLLRPQPVLLPEAIVRATGLQRQVVGNSANASPVSFLFDTNKLGNQIGQRMKVKRPGFLQEVSFHIQECTYDTLFYRVNVYAVKDDFPADNILPQPLYVRLSRRQVQDRIVIDLRRYRLWVTADVVVALELVKTLGPGLLQLTGTFLGGPSYALEQAPEPADPKNPKPKGAVDLKVVAEKQPNGGPWTKTAGIGVGIDATLLQVPR